MEKNTKQVPAIEAGMKYPQAFCLMRYGDALAKRDQKGGYIEEVWNARDGVTPFTIPSKDGKKELSHIDFHRDVYLPFYTPPLGSRAFVDMTPEIAMVYARRYMTSLLEAAQRGEPGARPILDNIEQECIEEIMDKIHHPEALSDEQNADPLYGYIKFLHRRAVVSRPGEPALIDVDEAFLSRLAELRQKARGPLFDGPITINALVMRAVENSIQKGFFPTQIVNGQHQIASVNVLEKLLFIVSEVSEATEIFRHPREGLADRWQDEKGKPQGFGSELADIIIRTAGLAGALGIDLEREIREKMEYNVNRPYKHGKKYTEQ